MIWIAKLKEGFRKYGIWILGALGALLRALTLYKGDHIRRLVNKADKAKDEAQALAGDARVEAEKQRTRIREAEANAMKVEELDKRFDKLKKKHNIFPIILIGLILAGLMAVPVKAAELPTDYESLKALYFAALDQIVTLKLDLEEAIMIAEGYREAYETEKRVRQEAEEAVTRGLARERELLEIVSKQHNTILALASSSRKNRLTLTGGIALSTSTIALKDCLSPSLFVAIGIGF